MTALRPKPHSILFIRMYKPKPFSKGTGHKEVAKNSTHGPSVPPVIWEKSGDTILYDAAAYPCTHGSEQGNRWDCGEYHRIMSGLGWKGP